MKRILFVIICLVWSVSWSILAIKATPVQRELINLVYTNIIYIVLFPIGGVAVKREVQRLFF
jgi:hypothetical protein